MGQDGNDRRLFVGVSHQRRNGGDMERQGEGALPTGTFDIIRGESKKEKCLMGRVSAFLGMVFYMYPEKNGRHNRPHVHVLY